MIDIPTPDPEPAAPQRSRGWLFRMQPLFTALIAITAIGLAVWEGLENRRHNRMSVRPRLNAAINAGSNPDGEYVRMSIDNNGLGPAVLTRFRIYLDGVEQDTGVTSSATPWTSVIEAVTSGGPMTVNAQALGGDSYYMPAGESVVPFEMIRPPGLATTDSTPLFELLDRVGIQVCYCSIYGTDCDELVLATKPPEVEPCER